MTAMMSALVGGAVTALVAIHVNRKQIISATISSNRQAWINTLRDEVSFFVAALQVVNIYKSVQTTFTQTDMKAALLNLLKHEAKIRLLINPNESDHVHLIEELHKALGVASQVSEGSLHDIRENVNNVISVSQIILKREWERVKSGE